MTCRGAFLSISNLAYQGNPTQWTEWKSLQANNPIGYDAMVTLPNGKKISLELKYRTEGGKVYHSWFAEDWLPRDADIYVTNNVEAISYNDRRILEAAGKKLMSLSEAVVYLSELIRNILYPNQLSNWNCSLKRIIIGIKTRITNYSSKSTNTEHGIKNKLKNSILKTSTKPGFSRRQIADTSLPSISTNTTLSDTALELPILIETSPKFKEYKLADWLIFRGKEVSASTLKQVWDRLLPNTPMANIRCFVTPKTQLTKIMNILLKTGSKMDGYLWEHGKVIAADETAGVCFPFGTTNRAVNYILLIMYEKGIPDSYLSEILIHEIKHVVNKDFLKFKIGRESLGDYKMY
jgi:hypothetical protein